ncbi:hypothetical protein SPRG_13990 [Saprolegnia parasitica CBS 223.65]|uniref:Uncharacterized protein n=1 Tax=Saprolegnia parasitica (strain CBS 223.65) TaxID=695850 RepID=A0A067C0W8_SAPPC|nr:hypothetical protein SPRG_13990 [Saprolegnia parasitica CBS 223.65]KDO20472.1 hypothetical protein SPRG_13990 [Saprolegnia parasitica CBS 223.65]|eukprot:XP_012208799.1 hypothetical protein SPRG_13990 [Saprolegnia parasitica CBS 223.65]
MSAMRSMEEDDVLLAPLHEDDDLQEDEDDDMLGEDDDDDLMLDDDDGGWSVDLDDLDDVGSPTSVATPDAYGYEELLSRVNLSSEEDAPFTFLLPTSCDDSMATIDESAPPSECGSIGGDETDSDDVVCWGENEADEKEYQDIDHRVICDKQNRFWAPADETSASSPSSDAKHMTSMVAPLPSTNVTESGRMVNRILASCLKKRKLHVPYKHQVKLVNFTPVVAKTTPTLLSSTKAIMAPVRTLPSTIAVSSSSSYSTSKAPDEASKSVETAPLPPFIAMPANHTPTMSKARDKDHVMQPNEDRKKIETSTPKKLPTLPVLGVTAPHLTKKVAQEKRKHAMMATGLTLASFKVTPMPLTPSADDSDVDMMAIDQELLDLCKSITDTTSRILRPKVDFCRCRTSAACLRTCATSSSRLRQPKSKSRAPSIGTARAGRVRDAKCRTSSGRPSERCSVA